MKHKYSILNLYNTVHLSADCSDRITRYVISGFRPDADEICALLGYYTALSGNPLPTFRYNVLVPFSRVKKSKKTS
jgi:hypothetical protein